MTKVYLLWWDNGQKFDDHDVILLGVYTTEEKRKKAEELFGAIQKDSSGEYIYTEEEVDVVSQKTYL